MKRYLIPLFIITSIISCSEYKENTDNKTITTTTSNIISTGKNLADSPFMTLTHENKPVLSWVEGDEDSLFLYYSISEDNGKTFSTPIEVSSTNGLNPHKESMPKLAFKSDGTIVALYQKRTPIPKNRFAGAIYYTQSKDNGITWTKSKYLHSDTTHGIGRSFFDITALPDGEVGAIWLDGRKRQRNGSTLCFAKTSPGNGFGQDIEIGQKTCQCCRTDIFVDDQNLIHVAYRDIINDSIRDIVHLSSPDNGISFTESTRISEDNWVINGCPHTGPSITNSKNGVSFFWFTSGGTDGVYTTNLTRNTTDFSNRELINPHARHPQAITLKNGTHVLSWDETFKTSEGFINKIGIRFKTLDGKESVKYITTEHEDCNHPVLIESIDSQVVLAWVQKTILNETAQVYHTAVSFE